MPGRRSLRRAMTRMAGAAAWNGRWLWARSQHRKPGVTIVIVNFNGDGFIQVAHSAIRRFAPADLPILVVDNASRDGSVAWLRAQPDIHTVFLNRNIGHG